MFILNNELFSIRNNCIDSLCMIIICIHNKHKFYFIFNVYIIVNTFIENKLYSYMNVYIILYYICVSKINV